MKLTAPLDHASGMDCTGDCAPVARQLSWIGDRWTLPVVVTLYPGPYRFNQLRREVKGISQQMLTRTLRSLEREGMVTRTVHPSVPPQVEYALTDLGRSLAAKGLDLAEWVHPNNAAFDANRTAYDARSACHGDAVVPAAGFEPAAP